MENLDEKPIKIKKTADMTTYQREYARKYKLKNPEKIIQCDICNVSFKKNSKSRHLQTEKHKTHIKLNEYKKLLDMTKSEQ